jgi:hypothetical protein
VLQDVIAVVVAVGPRKYDNPELHLNPFLKELLGGNLSEDKVSPKNPLPKTFNAVPFAVLPREPFSKKILQYNKSRDDAYMAWDIVKVEKRFLKSPTAGPPNPLPKIFNATRQGANYVMRTPYSISIR